MSLLQLAREMKWQPLIERIYTHSYEMFDQDSDGWNIFHHACYRQPPLNIIRVLLDMMDHFENTPSLNSNDSDNEYESDDEESEHRFAMKANNSGCTALHYACQYSSPKVVYLIVRLHPYAVSVTDSEGLTSLNYIFRSSETPKESCHGFLKTLILLKVDRKLAMKNQHLQSAIELHCTKYKQEITELLNDSDMSQKAKDSLTEFWRVLILLTIASDPDFNISRNIVEKLRDSANFHTFTLLHPLLKNLMFSASNNILMDVLLAILKTFPNQAQLCDDKGNYPLHTLLNNYDSYPIEKMPCLIQALISAYPQAAQTNDSSGKLPFYIALENGLKMNDGLRCIINAHPNVIVYYPLFHDDERFFPFALAMSKSDGLQQISFELLRTQPHLVRGAMSMNVRKRKYWS